jgi:PKD repeat protein
VIASMLNMASNPGRGPSGASPVASFQLSDQNPTVGEQLQLTDTSTNGPTSWSWEANGQLFSTAQNPTFYCGSAGYISFNLTAQNVFGSSSHSQQIYVSA